MLRRLAALTAFVITTGLLVTLPSEPAPALPLPAAQPNIILITTDDQAVEDMQHMPYTRDLLVRQGVTFTDALAPYSLCCPARATILTGQLAHNHGVLSNGQPFGGYPAFRPLNNRSLVVWLQNAGYHTTLAGKYLNGYGREDPREIPQGWDNWNAIVEGLGAYDYYGTTWNHNGQLVDRTGSYQADVAQDVVEASIRDNVAQGRPFFVWQSNLAPHGACWPDGDGGCTWGSPMPAERDETSFSRLALGTADDPSFNERVVAEKPSNIRSLDRWGERRIARATEWHRQRVRSLQAVDRNVRDTVSLLSNLGQLDNTLILFTSDNGFMNGEHRYRGKILPYEPSLRVPLVLRGLDLPRDVTRTQTAALVDLAATIAEAAGAQPILTQDGRSLLPLARGTSTRGYDALSIEAGPPGGATTAEYFYQGVRTGRYTYVEYPRTGEFELYDRRGDPAELNNVAYRPTHASTRAALASMLDRIRACAGEVCRTVGGAVPLPTGDGTPVHPDELASVGTAAQVVTITASTWSSSEGTAVAWQRDGRTWRVARGPFPVSLGRNGMVFPGANRHETSETASGAFRPARAMGLLADPGTALPYRRLDADDLWPYDPNAPRTYSVFQPRRSATATWRAWLDVRFAETPRRFPHALVVNQNLPRGIYYSTRFRQYMANTPADVRKGSFVIHAGASLGNHGWVSMDPVRLGWLLEWMRPYQQETTFVVGTPRYLRNNL